MRRIDIVLGSPDGRGGLEKVVSWVSQELKRRGHKVRVFLQGPPKYAEWVPTLPEVIYYDPRALQIPDRYEGELDLFRLALGYRSLIEVVGRPDVILATHTPLFATMTRLGSIGAETPLILSWLHGPPHVYGGASLLRFADGHLAISQGVADALRAQIPGAPTVHYLGNPIDFADAQRIPRPATGLDVLFIGRLENTQKRLDVLLKALAALTGEWHLTVIGDGPDGPMLNAMATFLDIESRVTWKGWMERPWDSVATASILALTSDFEGFGLVLVEALARGLPVLATDCEGPTDIVRNGENGWIVRRSDPSAVAVLFQGLIDGTIDLPEPETCVSTSLPYRVEGVVDRLEHAIDYTEAFKSYRN